MQKKIVVTGAGGFIGSHFAEFLVGRGYWVRGVDIKEPEFSTTACHEFLRLDLRDRESSARAVEGMREVYAFAADMGGMGFIAGNHARILHNNALINLHTLDSARAAGVRRYFFSSSACVYPEYRQLEKDAQALKEEDVYPAQPQDAYGWEKLITERLCQHYHQDFGLETRMVRFHNIFGPQGTWRGGREKAPAAICRKVARAKLAGNPEIEIWGDGKQQRSFCYIDDCVEGIYKIMQSDCCEPLNLGQDRLISIDGLVDAVAKIAGMDVVKKYIQGPQGVRSRNSDNTRLKELLDWEPRVSLEKGLEKTYAWIEKQVSENPSGESDLKQPERG